MKNFTLAILFLSLSLPSFATIHTVTTPGFSFSPAAITILQGDTVEFNIGGIHKVIEVSQATWDNNGNTPLSGGFNLPFGPGTLLPADLTPGMHFYVCQPHANMGMKGTIFVEGVLGTQFGPYSPVVSVYPNPAIDKVILDLDILDETQDYQIQVLSLTGAEVFTKTNTGFQSKDEINLGYLPKGMYILRINVSGATEARKIILQ